VESEGRGWSSGIEGDDLDNVVRLPREWIGPLEELVPIGPRADPSAEAARQNSDTASGRSELHEHAPRASASGSDQLDADSGTDCLTADAFWGAGSRALHQVVQLPHADQRLAERAAAPTGARDLTGRREVPGPRWHLTRSRLGLGCLACATVLVWTLVAVSTVADPSYAPNLKSHSSEPLGQALASLGGGTGHARGGEGRHASRRRAVVVHRTNPHRSTSRPGNASAHEAQVTAPSTITDASTGGAAGGTRTSAAKSTSTPTAGSTVKAGSIRSVGASSGAALAANGLPAPGGPPPP
jgi:hypothetical protein